MPESEPNLRDWLQRLEATPTDRLIAACGYIPFLFFLPLMRSGDDSVRFHGKQSLVLLAALVGGWVLIWIIDLVLGKILGSIFLIGSLFRLMAWIAHYLFGGALSLSYFIAIVIAAAQALGGRRWRIPVVAAFAEQLQI